MPIKSTDLFFIFWLHITSHFRKWRDQASNTHMYLYYKVTHEEGAPRNDVAPCMNRACFIHMACLFTTQWRCSRTPKEYWLEVCLFRNAVSNTEYYMTTQQEFCCFACSIKSNVNPTYNTAFSEMNETLTIKHFRLSTEPVTLLDQAINFFPSFQHALNRLMQHDLRLVQFFLDLHYAVCLLRILIFLEVFLELWKG